VSVGTDLTRKLCDGGIVNMKNTTCEPTEKINIKEKWSDVVAGSSTDRRNKDYIQSSVGIKHNLMHYRGTM
jgi:hypothetical protein